MRISDDRIEEVKKISLEEFFENLEMEKINNRYICPFHDDNKPSFTIKDDNIWSCWSCNETGKDIIDFVKKYYNLDFIKAIDFLESKYGISGSEEITFENVIKNKTKKNRKEIIFYLDKVENEICNLVKNSTIDIKKKDKIYRKMDNFYIKYNIMNFDDNEQIFDFKDKLLELQDKVEVTVVNG